MARVSIEDCLDVLDNRFALVLVASDRTRQIMTGDEILMRSKNREAVTSLREIAEGHIVARFPENHNPAEAPAVVNGEAAPAAPVELQPAPSTH